MRVRAAWMALALLSAACPSQERKATPGVGEPSPNASILPAPLASGELESKPRRAGDDAGLAAPLDSAGHPLLDAAAGPPRPLREDEPPETDNLSARDAAGVTLDAQFKWLDVPGPPAAPELDQEGLKEARQKTALNVSIDLAAAGRMRFRIASVAFPLALNSELRARYDRYGYVLVWPDGNAYRVLPKGALRSVFAERRADVAPLVEPKLRKTEQGSLQGYPTTRVELGTQSGQLSLEQASIPAAGASGELLCRLLLELLGAAPSSAVCSDQLTPLKAEYRWAERGRLAFEVGTISKRADLPVGLLYVPPFGAMFKPGELPPESSGVFLNRQALGRFRTRETQLVLSNDDKAPGEGILAVNRTDALEYLLIDGIPVAWIRPHSEKYIIGLRRGRYQLTWRDFLGMEAELRKVVEVPARLVVGREDEPRSAQ